MTRTTTTTRTRTRRRRRRRLRRRRPSTERGATSANVGDVPTSIAATIACTALSAAQAVSAGTGTFAVSVVALPLVSALREALQSLSWVHATCVWRCATSRGS
eukprot:SM000012S25383  [mRNA]  locus=s12:699542:700159:- [translate_table: standard]